MIAQRHCSKPGCSAVAVATLTPLGWQVVRLATTFEPAPPSGDDLAALVDAVRRVAQEAQQAPASAPNARTPRTGPYASARSVGNPDTSSPLDPSSPYARRRAQFTVVDGEEGADRD